MTPSHQKNSPFFTNNSYRPLLFDLSSLDGRQGWEAHNEHNKGSIRQDQMDGMIGEWIKISHPQKRLKSEEIQEGVRSFFQEHPREEYGFWVYYPWRDIAVRIPEKEIFTKLRTSRNQIKITEREQDILGTKTIGVVGLSVGQSVALTLAMERVGGKLKLADFDELDLSNLNRIRSGIFNVSLSKCTIAAREIAEIDPFLEVDLFFDGITSENIDHFLGGEDPIDILIEECDSLPVKIELREKARSLGLPVIMDTSDRGMLDIERFDLERDRPLLHGIVPGLSVEMIRQLPEQARVPMMLQLVGGTDISSRMKASMIEVGNTLTTWPQLASSIMLGGGIAADAARRILLGEKVRSGRFYFDTIDQFVEKPSQEVVDPVNGISSQLSLCFSEWVSKNDLFSISKGFNSEQERGPIVLPAGITTFDLPKEDMDWVTALHGSWLRGQLLGSDSVSGIWSFLKEGGEAKDIQISNTFLPYIGLLNDQETRAILKNEGKGMILESGSALSENPRQAKAFILDQNDPTVLEDAGKWLGQEIRSGEFELLAGSSYILRKALELFTKHNEINSQIPSKTAQELFTLMQKLEQEHITAGILITR